MLIKQSAFSHTIPTEVDELILDDNGAYYDPKADYTNHENRPVISNQSKNKFKLLNSIKQHPFKWSLGGLGTAGGLLGLAYYLSHNNEKKKNSAN